MSLLVALLTFEYLSLPLKTPKLFQEIVYCLCSPCRRKGCGLTVTRDWVLCHLCDPFPVALWEQLRTAGQILKSNLENQRRAEVSHLGHTPWLFLEKLSFKRHILGSLHFGSSFNFLINTWLYILAKQLSESSMCTLSGKDMASVWTGQSRSCKLFFFPSRGKTLEHVFNL